MYHNYQNFVETLASVWLVNWEVSLYNYL